MLSVAVYEIMGKTIGKMGLRSDDYRADEALTDAIEKFLRTFNPSIGVLPTTHAVTCARSAVIDSFRRATRRPTEGDTGEGSAVDVLPMRSLSPEDLLIMREKAEIAVDALGDAAEAHIAYSEMEHGEGEAEPNIRAMRKRACLTRAKLRAEYHARTR